MSKVKSRSFTANFKDRLGERFEIEIIAQSEDVAHKKAENHAFNEGVYFVGITPN